MKAQAPLLSIGSSGSFAGIMVAATWKGRPYLRQLVTPSNPKSALQTAFRAMFKFLGQAWGELGASPQASWETLAEQGNYTSFNAYMKYNQNRWGRALAPVIDPDQAAGTPGVDDEWSAAAGVRSVTLTLDMGTAADQWGAVIYMEADNAPEGTQDEVIQVVPVGSDETVEILVTQLTPGTVYHFKYKSFTTGGTFGTLSADINATPTT